MAQFPLEIVEPVVFESERCSARERDLRAHVMVYYAIALALYAEVSTREVLQCVVEGARWLGDPLATTMPRESGSNFTPVLTPEMVHHLRDDYTRGNAISNENCVPATGSVSTHNCDPIDVRKLWQMANPRPAFENRNPEVLGRKLSNNIAITSCGIPSPVSFTQKSTRLSVTSSHPMETEPCRVYFSAFVVRLSRMRLSAAG